MDAAETILFDFAKAVLGRLGSYAADEIIAAWGAKDELKKLHTSLETICVVLRDAERKQSNNEGLKLWLKRLKGVVYDIDDLSNEAAYYVLERWMIKTGTSVSAKVRHHFSYSNPIILAFKLSHKVKRIRGKLDQFVKENRDFGLSQITDSNVYSSSGSSHRMTQSFVSESDILGREIERRVMVEKVLEVAARDTPCMSIISVVGIGGLGKTTLAQLVFRDAEKSDKFDTVKWVWVSRKFVLERIIGDIIVSATNGTIDRGNVNLEQLRMKMHVALSGKKLFLVLDDVWTTNVNEWKKLEDLIASCVGKGSVVLITSRLEKFAKITRSIETYNLHGLPFDVCLSIFKRCVSRKDSQIKDPNLLSLGETIVAKCGGVPLAVKALGSMLCGVDNVEEWRRIAHISGLWSIEENEDGILPALKLSYDELPYYLKSCFAHMCLLPKGNIMSEEGIITFWICHDLIQQRDTGEELEDIGKKYLLELLSRSLLQVEQIAFDGTVSVCKMHDLVHDLAMKVMGEELALVSHKNVTTYVRHIAWDCDDDDLSKGEFLKKLLPLDQYRKQVRSFTILFSMTHKLFIEEIICIFPYLRVLDISFCQFEKLPDSIGTLKHLRFLDMSYNHSIKELPKAICKLLNLQLLDLNHCEKLEEMPKDIGKLVSLRELFCTVSKQRSLSMIGCHTSLRFIQINHCDELTSFSEEAKDHHDSQRINSTKLPIMLLELGIFDCPKLSSLPKSLMYCTALKRLYVARCESLVNWNMELDPPQSSPPPVTTECGSKSAYGLTNLESLQITGVPKKVGLPDGLKSAAGSLKYLMIRDCVGLAGLPDWLESFKCLSELIIYDCLNLSVLPIKGLRGLTALEELDIRGCPHLRERCAKDKGDYWPYIHHIPTIVLDDSWIQQREKPTS